MKQFLFSLKVNSEEVRGLESRKQTKYFYCVKPESVVLLVLVVNESVNLLKPNKTQRQVCLKNRAK